MKRNNFTFLFFLISTLCIGQTWQWAKSGNGVGPDEGAAVCTDLSGNIYVTGTFYSPLLTFDSYTLTNSGDWDIYLVKYSPNGNVLWAKSAGGQGTDMGLSLAADQSGNIFLVGFFNSPSITFGPSTLTNTGNEDSFIAKYDPNGNALWAQSAVGSGTEEAVSVCVDVNQNALVTGFFKSPTLTFGTYTLTNSGTSNVFVTKYNTNGNVLWTRCSTGSYGYSSSISSDGSGNSFVAGSFAGNPLALAFGSYTLNGAGNSDLFIVKYDINGNVLWANRAGGVYSDYANSVCAESNGDLYITGKFQSPSIVLGNFTLTGNSNFQMFISKYDSYGNVIWAKSQDSQGINEEGYTVCTDQNNVYVSGKFGTSVTFGTYTLSAPPGSNDPMFIVKYDGNGNVTYATALSSGGDDINSIAMDNFCNLYLTGDFIGSGNPSTFFVGSNTLTATGVENVFLARLPFPLTCAPSAIKEASSHPSQLFIFPNPTKDSFKFQIYDEVINGEFALITTAGEKIHQQKIIQGMNEIKIYGLPPGMYNCVLIRNGSYIYTNRLIIE